MAEDSVLGRILAQKRVDVARRKAATPLEALQVAPSRRSLEEALRGPHTGFIMECKKASPSRGLLRADLDPAALATDYAQVADAISVIVDEPFFQGELEWLGRVSAAVPSPVLCKDFVVEPYQVYEARSHGADAILLMLSVLDDEGYRACAAVADALSVDVLTEVHDAEELARAERLGARIVGINNRDLKTLQVDLATTEELAASAPAGSVLVSESGVFTHQDVRRLRGLAHAFLVGTSLVLAEDGARVAARRLAYGRVKVCGLTRPEDARAAFELGATWAGLIFAPSSPRCVSPEQAKRTRDGVEDLRWVGVFVNEEPHVVAEHADSLRLVAVQLHGEESPEYVASLRPLLPEGCEVWKAVRVRDAVPTLAETGADRLLLDAHKAGQRGGTGETFDWSLLAEHPERERCLLAGGLTPENASAADAVGAWALDVNSGVEQEPGIKSRARLRELFAALRG